MISAELRKRLYDFGMAGVEERLKHILTSRHTRRVASKAVEQLAKTCCKKVDWAKLPTTGLKEEAFAALLDEFSSDDFFAAVTHQIVTK